MRIFLYLIIPFLLCSVTSAEVIKQSSFQANSDGINVTLRWITSDETNVARFEIERRQGTEGEFLPLSTVEVKGASLYEFTDYSPFLKITGIYQYRIKIVFTNNSNPVYVGPVTVTHIVNGVRRTWGSIKAMFR